MNVYRDIRRGYWLKRIFYKTLIYFMVFHMMFLGVPLPFLHLAPQPVKKLMKVLDISEADAAGAFKSLQAGTISITGSAKAGTATLSTAIDPQKTMLVPSEDAASGVPGESDATVEVTSPTQIYAQRGKTGVGTYVHFSTVEFIEGAFVQSGYTKIAENTGVKNVVLAVSAPVDKSIVLFNQAFTALGYGSANGVPVAAWLTDANTLHCERFQANGNFAVEIAWQVITFNQDVTVYANRVDFTSGTTMDTDFVTGKTVNMDKSFIIASSMGTLQNSDLADTYVSAEFVDGDTIRFTRKVAGESCRVAYAVVEFSDETRVLRGKIAGTTSKNFSATLTSSVHWDATNLRPYRAFPIYRANSTSTTALNDSWLECWLSAANTINFARAGAGNVDICYFVVEMPTVKLTSPNGGELWKVGETRNITWKHADCAAVGGTGPSNHHKVKLEFSIDGGTSFPATIATDLDGTTDSYPWTIPDTITVGSTNTIGNNLRVKITDLDAAVPNYDISNASFEIIGQLNLTVPDGGEVWAVGTQHYIKWTRNGDATQIGNINIKYSTDSGSTFPTTCRLT